MVERNKAIFIFGALSIIWGSTWYFIKVGLNHFPPFLFAGVRFLIAGGLLSGILFLSGIKLPRNIPAWRYMILSSFLQITFPYAGVFWGEQFISSGLSAVLNSSIPLFVALLAHFTLVNDRLTTRKLIGLCVSFVGILIIFKNDLGGNAAMVLGGLAMIGSSISAACANVYAKHQGASLDPLVTVAVHLSCGGIVLTMVSRVLEPQPRWHWTGESIIALLFLSIFGSLLAFIGLYWLIKHTDVTKVATLSFITPIVAVIVGTVTLGEHIGFNTLLGIAIIFCGIYFVTWKKNEKNVHSQQEDSHL
jgi:drug/metabolite transporter (DMT)-like permease